MARYKTQDGDVLDAICFAHYGETVGVVEFVLSSNQHLLDYPVHLPSGLIVELPELELTADEVQHVRLWD